MDPVRVRYAPSPTGRHHIGGARTALYNYLLAQQTGGQFILRFEDTDQKRFQEGSEEEIMRGLRWLGVTWDEGPGVGGPHAPYRQTPKKERYLAYAQQLIDSDRPIPAFVRLSASNKFARNNKRISSSRAMMGTAVI